ncbi:hypothetical protein HEP73_03844 [Xanthomonas sp. GW]|nr:hypothetical protein HEP73_03844 [Xanthomonas sp. GW]
MPVLLPSSPTCAPIAAAAPCRTRTRSLHCAAPRKAQG